MNIRDEILLLLLHKNVHDRKAYYWKMKPKVTLPFLVYFKQMDDLDNSVTRHFLFKVLSTIIFIPTQGRYGKGTIFTFAAGNGCHHDGCNDLFILR